MKMCISLIRLAAVFAVTFFLVNCGSAESIKSYSFRTHKDHLEDVVMNVIESNPHIYLDTITQHKLDSMALTQKHLWTPNDSAEFYDNLNAFVRIKIKADGQENKYVLRYLGDRFTWGRSRTSALFISEVEDKAGHGLYQGKNEHGEFESQLAKESTALLEKEFISKIEQELK